MNSGEEPEKSSEKPWRVLLKAVPAKKRDVVREWLDVIEAPDDLRGIAHVARTYAESMEMLAGTAKSSIAKWACGMKEAADFVTEALKKAGAHIPQAEKKRLRTLCESNPAYAACLSTAINRNLTAVDQHLFGYLHYCDVRDRSQLSMHQRRKVYRGLRYLTATEDGIPHISRLTCDAGSTSALSDEMTRVVLGGSDKKTVENYSVDRCAPGRAERWRVVRGSRASRGVEPLWPALLPAAGRPRPAKQTHRAGSEYARDWEVPSRYIEDRRTRLIRLLNGKLRRSVLMAPGRGRGGGNGLHGEIVGNLVLTLDEFPETETDNKINVLAEQPDPVEYRDGARSGLDRRELIGAIHSAAPAVDADNVPLPRDRTLRRLRAGDQADQIAKRNQNDSWRRDQLTGFELYQVLATIVELSSSGEASKAESHGGLRSAVLAMSCLLLSQPPESVITMRWASPGKERLSNHVSLSNRKGNWTGNWHRPALTPVQNATLVRVDHSRLFEIQKHLMVPMPSWVAKLLGQWQTSLGGRLKGPVFDLSVEDARDHLRQFCARVAKRHDGMRITVERLCSHFYRRALQDADLGMVEAAQVFNVQSHLSATQLHYTASAATALAGKYERLCRNIIEEVIAEARARHDREIMDVLDIPPGQLQLPTGGIGDRERFVGSQLVPRTSSVQSAVKKLQNRIRLENSQKAGTGWVVRLHNSLALYTALLLSWGSGFRCVRHPLPDPRLLDPESGRLVICDKDDAEGTHTLRARESEAVARSPR